VKKVLACARFAQKQDGDVWRSSTRVPPVNYRLLDKVLWRALDDDPECPQCRTTRQVHERMVRDDPEGLGQPCLRDTLQASGIYLPWVVCPAGKQATEENAKTGDRQALQADGVGR
jgi:hypothetical protein